MFTDTKNLNLTNASHLDLALMSACKLNDHQHKSKGRLRKVWKPLLRLIFLKGGQTTRSATHPNNVNLNNASAEERDNCHLSSALLDDYAAAIGKIAPPTIIMETPQCAASRVDVSCCAAKTNVISSASIQKTPTPSCTGCIHGRNCQHEQFHHNETTATAAATIAATTSRLPIVIEAAIESDALDLPVHYICTDEGTFFWTSPQDKIDDDLLDAWLSHTFRQYPLQSTTAN